MDLANQPEKSNGRSLSLRSQYRRKLTEFLWDQLGGDLPNNLEDSRVGNSVDISADGSIVAFGAPGDFSAELPGRVRVFRFDGVSTWNQIGQDIDGGTARDRFGTAVALSSDGTILAIGAPQSAFENIPRPPGYVRIYQFNSSSSTWNQLGQEIVGEENDDESGVTVDLSSDGRTVAIGAPGNQGNSLLLRSPGGHVRVFTLAEGSSTWTQLGADVDGDAQFQSTSDPMAISGNGNVLAIGGTNRSLRISRVRIFEFSNGSWNQRGQDIEGDAASALSFDVAFSEDGNIVAVSDPNSPDFSSIPSGRVRVFQYDGSSTWNMRGQEILGTDGAFLGTALDLSANGNILAISAPNSDFGNEISTGLVRVFEFGGSWTQISQDIRGEAAFAQAGSSLALSSDGSILAIGFPRFSDRGTIEVYVRTDRTPAPTLSPQPTIAPTTFPTFEPEPPKFFCFSGDSTIQVQHREDLTKMQDLKLGDYVLVAKDKYEPIYSFGHKLPLVNHAGFLQISVFGADVEQRITLTPDHMIFVGSKGRAVPASQIEIGDELQTLEAGAETLGTVSDIAYVAASGIFAPFTPSGTLIVDGIRVSAFTSVQGSEMVHVLGTPTGFSHHWLDRTLELPHRIWCHDLGPCSEETYIDGMSTWMHVPHEMFQWWNHQSLSVQTATAIPFAAWVSLLACLDVVVSCGIPAPICFCIFVAMWAFLRRRRQHCSTKTSS